jgi:3D (Asp-Asp-Asp) domain-containing protein
VTAGSETPPKGFPAIDPLLFVEPSERRLTPAAGTVLWPTAVPVPDLPPFIGSGRPKKLPRRRLGQYAGAMFALVFAIAIAATGLRVRTLLAPAGSIVLAPVVISAPIQLDGALVRGASKDWAVGRDAPLRYGDPVPVTLTAYCLRGLTRRDHYVRQGIVASDPKIFPLGRYVEIYVGRAYYGRFLIDDTGRAIKGGKLDIWTPTCREARLFGRTQGTAVLVPRPVDARRDTLLTGRLGGAMIPDSLTHPRSSSR